MGPQTLVSLGNDAADRLARWGALLLPSAVPCSLSPLISRINFYFLSDLRRTISTGLEAYCQNRIFHRGSLGVL